MDVPAFIVTSRLVIRPLTLEDDNFILELVNTKGWLKFIGNRNITSPEESRAYVQRILENEDIFYWLVKLKDNQDSIGIITYIKRTYLDYHDIGFAFLPKFSKKGYAHEATNAVLNKLMSGPNFSRILATTIPGNTNSIKLLTKIGLVFEKEIEVENKKLHVYGASTHQLKLK